MRQALHIFLKDSRQFRYPIAILLAWTAVFVVAGAEPWPEGFTLQSVRHWKPVVAELARFIFPIAWCYLIVQIMHAEALPGVRQFWVTRPYHRGSLAAAKAMFVVAYVLVPLMLAQAAIVVLSGLPLTAYLPGLLWAQVLFITLVVLPAAAVAAMTSKLTQFVLVTLVAPVFVLVHTVVGDLRPWGGFGWIRTSLAVGAGVAVALAILVVQFRSRRTSRSRLIALTGTLVVLAALPMLPWPPAFALQSQLGGRPTTDPRVELVRPEPRPSGPHAGAGDAMVTSADPAMQFKFRSVGGADSTPIVCEASEVTLEGPNGRRWSGQIQPTRNYQGRNVSGGCAPVLRPPPEFLEAVAGRPVTLRAVLYVTLWGPEQSTPVPIGQGPTAIPGAGWCVAFATVSPTSETLTFGHCRTAFRQPRLAATLRGQGVWGAAMDFSPFPAYLWLLPVETDGFAWPALQGPSEVTVTTRARLAHVRTIVTADNLTLRDFEVGLNRPAR